MMGPCPPTRVCSSVDDAVDVRVMLAIRPLRAEVARRKVRQEVALEIADQIDDIATIIHVDVVSVEPDLLEDPQ